MATRARDHEPEQDDAEARARHDEWVRGKVLEGLAQSRDRAAMKPIEQVWRDLLP